jgi:hypothetical protein
MRHMPDMLRRPALAPLGNIEPHAALLCAPADGQLLYKVMTVENFLRSVEGGYLHFNRVDSYGDSPTADWRDGEQLPGDREGNAATRFAKAPDFSGAHYYDQCRARTYACCFSLENSGHIWATYGNGNPKGKICVVFEFSRLRATLNQTLQTGGAALMYNDARCRQLFSINYGIVKYVDIDSYRANTTTLPNPIVYTYLKDKQLFVQEQELRISLSAIGIGRLILDDGSEMNFPSRLHMGFDFKAAFATGTIEQVLHGPDCDTEFLRAELRGLGAETREG